ncbi:glycosyltransferase family 2 protein [Adhaeribacter pallidiroseus]|uniref:GalNAc(5)-diNAcBac-PP-undecaprenol beta-1,3-glucosyltransferase n=1 Tax=Adhaeribacter pallidiroseus TaxID=2072847 RepID=A0A369QI66_9BACT|nr:glycosyltransferase family 2 protein [Adhaeribacter pallidiroseus]RDC64112.1 GalNAc(5)-diNAcBac-PP-undecaprenol beta-1,3-glucosyltransferase [Adhaeribacter pallidiroseus]
MEKVSIIMPAFNSEAYIEESINSVLSQTYSNWELIIIDDGSTDNTGYIVGRYINAHQNIFYRKHSNRGQALTRNVGINLSNGELIAFLDSDDLWLPETLQILHSTLKEKNVDFVFCSFNRLENGFIQEEPKSEFPSGILNSVQMLAILALYNPLVIHGVLTYRKVLLEAGMFEVNPKLLNCSEDYNLWIKIALCGRMFFGLPLPLAIYRRHSAGTHTNRIKMLEAEIFVHSKYMGTDKESQIIAKRLLRAKYRQLISAYLYSRQRIKAEEAFKRLLEFDKGGLAVRLVFLIGIIFPFKLAHSLGTRFIYPIEYRILNIIHGQWSKTLERFKNKIVAENNITSSSQKSFRI